MRFLPDLIFVIPALAQWPDLQRPVDLNGPAPKSADGKPDFSGVWARASAPGQTGWRQFQDLPSIIPGGLPFQPWAAELRRKRFEQNSKDHPDAYCLPLHPVQLHSHPQPRKIVHTPGMMLMMYEANDGLRQIFTDGRALPKIEDVNPWWYGYAVGRWEGDTLVVESLGYREDSWIDEQGSPGTDRLQLTERFRRPNFGTLDIELTVNDPKAYTKPFTFKLTQRLMPNTELIEFVCAENNRSTPHLVGK
jgi:hypothetical protein